MTQSESNFETFYKKAVELVGRMTLEEKAGLTSGLDFWHTKGVERLDVEPVMVTDGPHGLRKARTDSAEMGLENSVPATCFPTAATLGSTWDPELLERVGVALGEETAANDVAVLLGPGVNMKRSPLCGRNFEYFSEDPLVAGEASTALINGIQSQGVGTSLKHFAANSQETDRLRVDELIDERTLREIYLPAFERAVRKAQPWTVMCSYNKINGVYASENPWLLTQVLRDDWGYQGMVVSDWGAVSERVPGLRAGLDLEMPASGGVTDAQIVEAVRTGELDESVLDQAAVRVLTVILRGHATLDAPDCISEYDVDAHHALAREAAAAGTVLLRNEVGADEIPALPLSTDSFSAETPLVLVGEFARTPRYQGAGSSQIVPTQLDNALEALQQQLGTAAVKFCPGYQLAEAQGKSGQELPPEELRAQAVDAARGQTAVLLVGLPQISESEGYDRTTMAIPAEQVELIHEVSAVATRTVVVLVGGSAMDVAQWHEEVDALAVAWLGGQAGGAAIADVLLGLEAPTGHLAESLPLALEHLPAQLNFPGIHSQVIYGEGVFIGYRGLDAMGQSVAYPFGHGLTYTDFALENLQISAVGGETIQAKSLVSASDSAGQDDVVATVRATLRNVGARAGSQVVQLYLGRSEDSAVARAPRELRAFTKVTLEAGESQKLEFSVTQRDLSYWDAVSQAWVVESGEYEISLGFSSRDLRQQTLVSVVAPAVIYPLSWESTYAEWLDHPLGGTLLRTEEPKFVKGMEADQSTYEIMRHIPMNRLAVFPGVGFGHDRLRELLAKSAK